MRFLQLWSSRRLRDVRIEEFRRGQAPACAELHSCGKPLVPAKSFCRRYLQMWKTDPREQTGTFPQVSNASATAR
jgi:hypothetical protein